MKFNNGFYSYLAKKESNWYWNFIDNLAYKLDKIANSYYNKSIGSKYIDEYLEFGITDDDNVLHIGCGAYPLSEIILAESFGARVVGIDKNIKSVNSAVNVIENRNLNGRIKIIHGNGKSYPVNGFNVIIVSSCASPMLRIVENISENAKKNTRIIVREMETLVNPLINFLNYDKSMTLVKKICNNPFPFFSPFGWQSFYLLKK